MSIVSWTLPIHLLFVYTNTKQVSMDAAAGLKHCSDIYVFAAADRQRIIDIEVITD